MKFINQTSVEEEETEEVYISNFKKSQKQTSKEVLKINFKKFITFPNSNNTNINNTNLSENKSNHSADGVDPRDEMETLHAYQSLIKDNLDYDSLLVSHPI